LLEPLNDNGYVVAYVRVFAIKGCDSNFEGKCSKVKSWFKWNNYLAL